MYLYRIFRGLPIGGGSDIPPRRERWTADIRECDWKQLGKIPSDIGRSHGLNLCVFDMNIEIDGEVENDSVVFAFH